MTTQSNLARFDAAMKVLSKEQQQENHVPAFIEFAKKRNIVEYQLTMDVTMEMDADNYSNEKLLTELESVCFQVTAQRNQIPT